MIDAFVPARGAAACSLPDTCKAIIFRAKVEFFGQKPAAKKKKYLFIFIKRKSGIYFV